MSIAPPCLVPGEGSRAMLGPAPCARLLHDCLIDERAHELGVMAAERRLHHRNNRHLLLRIGPPVGREGAGPAVVAEAEKPTRSAARTAPQVSSSTLGSPA